MRFYRPKKFISIRNLPAFFERYEVFVIIAGVLIAFLFTGVVFYNNAYKTVNTVPEVEVEMPAIETSLFDTILEDIEEKKQLPPELPVIDPFR